MPDIATMTADVAQLKTRAAQAQQDIKAKQEQRVTSVKKQYNEWLNRLESRSS